MFLKYNAFYDNDNDAYVPKKWAMESLLQLYKNTVLLQLIHTEFKNEVQNNGDIVNTRRPGTFTAVRKIDGEAVTKQDATSTNVQIPLNQHIHISFPLYPVEQTVSFKSLVDVYLKPAMEAAAQAIEQTIASQFYQFIGNSYSKIGTACSKTGVIGARELLTTQKCPMNGRFLVLTPNSEGSLLDAVENVAANYIGDDGTALREGSLGRKFGFDLIMSGNLASISAGQNDTLTRAVNLTAGYAAGSTAIVIDGSGGTIIPGSWCTIAGDMTPQFITGYSSTSGTLTISPGLKYAVVNDAVVTIYEPARINLSGGYAANYHKDMVIDDLTKAPVTMQMLSTGVTVSTRNIYGCLPSPGGAPTNVKMYLDRPLVSAVANDAYVGVGPYGEYNFAGHRNAIAFISRPLRQPSSSNVASAVLDYKGVGLRVTIAYDGNYQADVVTIDLLCGIKVLDTNLGCLLYA